MTSHDPARKRGSWRRRKRCVHRDRHAEGVDEAAAIWDNDTLGVAAEGSRESRAISKALVTMAPRLWESDYKRINAEESITPWHVARRRGRENQGQEKCAEHRAERTQRDDTV